MAIFTPKGEIGEIEKALCANCRNDLYETYKPTTFCWVCGRKLWNRNKPTVRVVDGHPRTMHKFCSKHVDWMSEQERQADEQ